MSVAVQLPGKSRHAVPGTRRRRKQRRWLAPVVGVVSLIGLWELVTWGFSIRTFIVPSPVAVAQEFRTDHATLLANIAPTVFETVLGFAIGNGVAILLAIAFVHYKPFERALMPVAVFVRTIPIVAIAPVFVIIFGTGYTPKILIAGLICFFPTLVNMVRGLQAVDPQSLELLKVLSATRREVFFKLRIFTSLPFLFSALKIAATSSVIGAIVAEWIGSQRGLGYLIVQATYNYSTPLLYATMIIVAVFASSFFALVGIAEHLIVRWRVEERP